MKSTCGVRSQGTSASRLERIGTDSPQRNDLDVSLAKLCTVSLRSSDANGLRRFLLVSLEPGQKLIALCRVELTSALVLMTFARAAVSLVRRHPLPRRRKPASSDRYDYRGCIVAQMPAGKSRDLVEQAAQHAVCIRRAMSNDRFQKALVAELVAIR